MMQKAKDLMSLMHQVGRRLQLIGVPGQFPAVTQQKVFRALIGVHSSRTLVSRMLRLSSYGEYLMDGGTRRNVSTRMYDNINS